MGKPVVHLGLALGLSVLGCSKPLKPLLHRDRVTLVQTLDFSGYAAKGFFITPEEYRGDYDSQGFLEIEIYPKVQEQESAYQVRSGGGAWSNTTSDTVKTRFLAVEEITAEEALERMYQEAVRLGADALMKFEMAQVPNYLGPYRYTGIRLAGFAIRRRGGFK